MKELALVTVVLMVLDGCAPRPSVILPPVWPTNTPASAAAPTPAHKVQATKDVEHAKLLEADAPAQKLDVYAPAEPGPWPVVVVIHAGFQTKDSLRYVSLAKELAGRGAVLFVPQHRSMAGSVLEAAQENAREYREVYESCACAVRFARESAAQYGGDPGQVTMFSDHGRGLEAAPMGDDLQPRWEQVASSRGGPPQQVECLSAGDAGHVDAFVELSGHYEALEVLKDSEPNLRALTSPYAIIGGNPSLLVRRLFEEKLDTAQLERTQAYYEALRSAGYDAKLKIPADTRHEIPWSGPDLEALPQVILEAARP